MRISMIVAYGKNKELGLNNKLLWNIPEDLKKFKEITNSHHVLMGRNTYESILSYLKKPLPNRTSIVMTRNKDYEHLENTYKVSTFDEAIKIAKENKEEELIIIGGASIYKELFPYINRLYISEVNYEGEADCYFENNIEEKDWKLIQEENYKENENTLSWDFKIFDKK